jgi:predicted metal-binding membrane protein
VRAALLTLLAGTGYFAVWAAWGLAVFVAGAALAVLESRVPGLSRAVPVIAGVVVLSAGALQFTVRKAHYLGCCRQARGHGHGHVIPSSAAALRHGLRLGLHCSCCCAGLTAVLVVTGVMDLLAMAVVTAAITLERFAPRGERVARGIGFVVGGVGLFMIVRAAWLM